MAESSSSSIRSDDPTSSPLVAGTVTLTLATMPPEIEESILRSLDHRSLARTGMTCEALRDAVCASDRVWRFLHDRRWANGAGRVRRRGQQCQSTRSQSRSLPRPSSFRRDCYDGEEEAAGGRVRPRPSSDRDPDGNPDDDSDWRGEYVRRLKLDRTVLPRLGRLDLAFGPGRRDAVASLLEDGLDIYDRTKALCRHGDGVISALARKVLDAINKCDAFWDWKRLYRESESDEGWENEHVNIEDGPMVLAKYFQPVEALLERRSPDDAYGDINYEIDTLAESLKGRLDARRRLQGPRDDDDDDGRRYDFSNVADEMRSFFVADSSSSSAGSSRRSDFIRPFVGVSFGALDDLSNESIDGVLSTRKGGASTLAIIYAAVARRACGIILAPIEISGERVILREPGLATKEDDMFVDAYDGGRILDLADCQALSSHGLDRELWELLTFNSVTFRNFWLTIVLPIHIHICHRRLSEHAHDGGGGPEPPLPPKSFCPLTMSAITSIRQLADEEEFWF